jgi:hypothetical protein
MPEATQSLLLLNQLTSANPVPTSQTKRPHLDRLEFPTVLEFATYVLARVLAGVITALILSIILNKQRAGCVLAATC